MSELEPKLKVKEIQTAGEIIILTNHEGKRTYAIFEEVFISQTIGDDLPQFVYYDQTDNSLKTVGSVTKSVEEIYIPIERYLFAKTPGIQDYGSIESLYKEVFDFVYAHIDLTDEALYHIVTGFIIASYRIEDFDSVPYLLFLGEYMSGKTRALEVLAELCYRAIKTSSISPAAIVRMTQKHRVTMLVDETDILNHESRFELVGILNSGYKANDFYIRANPDSDDVETWKTFGLKAMAGTSDFNKALNSRCVEIPMERARRTIKLKIDREWASKLRMKLLDYRLKNVTQPLLEIELPFNNGRNHELFGPLVQVVPEQYRQIIINYGKNIEGQREIDNITSFEGDVARATIAVINDSNPDKIYTKDVVKKYALLNGIDTEVLDKTRRKLETRIGKVLRTKFHFIKESDKGYVVEPDKVERITERYAPDLSKKHAKLENSGTNKITSFTSFPSFEGKIFLFKPMGGSMIDDL